MVLPRVLSCHKAAPGNQLAGVLRFINAYIFKERWRR